VKDTLEKSIDMKIQILGTGCAKCNALTMATEKAAQSLGLQYELEKVRPETNHGIRRDDDTRARRGWPSEGERQSAIGGANQKVAQ